MRCDLDTSLLAKFAVKRWCTWLVNGFVMAWGGVKFGTGQISHSLACGRP